MGGYVWNFYVLQCLLCIAELVRVQMEVSFHFFCVLKLKLYCVYSTICVI